MNSSTGFKKRSLLRPPSSLKERERQYLKVFDISQSEPMIANQIKSQIMRIQQQINAIDKDKKIRTNEASLQKSYINTLKKWLREALNAQQKEEDDGKILKYIGADSFQSGFKKLWKILANLDHLITKVTELQIIQFLKYDQIYNQLCQDSEKTTQILSTLSKAGFSSGSFQISQVLLQRNKDLYSLLIESKRKGSSSFITNQPEQKSSRKSQTNQLIAQLQKQNSKLSQLLQELDKEKQNNQRLIKELKNKQQIIKENHNISNNIPKSATSIKSNQQAFQDIEDKYKDRISSMTIKIDKFESQISGLKISLCSTESRLKMAEEQLKQHDLTKGIKPKSGSYEQALVEEMDKMKKGFEKKIEKLLDDFNLKQKQMRKKEIQYKNQNQKVKWEKGLLLKKFDSMQNLGK